MKVGGSAICMYPRHWVSDRPNFSASSHSSAIRGYGHTIHLTVIQVCLYRCVATLCLDSEIKTPKSVCRRSKHFSKCFLLLPATATCRKSSGLQLRLSASISDQGTPSCADLQAVSSMLSLHILVRTKLLPC